MIYDIIWIVVSIPVCFFLSLMFVYFCINTFEYKPSKERKKDNDWQSDYEEYLD